MTYFTDYTCSFQLQCFLHWDLPHWEKFSCTNTGSVPWTAPAWVAWGLCTSMWSLLSARARVVTVAALPVVVGVDPLCLDCPQKWLTLFQLLWSTLCNFTYEKCHINIVWFEYTSVLIFKLISLNPSFTWNLFLVTYYCGSFVFTGCQRRNSDGALQ